MELQPYSLHSRVCAFRSMATCIFHRVSPEINHKTVNLQVSYDSIEPHSFYKVHMVVKLSDAVYFFSLLVQFLQPYAHFNGVIASRDSGLGIAKLNRSLGKQMAKSSRELSW